MRHSVETHLTNQNVNPRYIDFLQGLSQKGIGGSVYMKGHYCPVNNSILSVNYNRECL